MTVRLHDSEYRRATTGRFRLALLKSEYSWPENGESGAKFKVRKGGEGVLTRTATRLDLANWSVNPANPLTLRAFVNRRWRQFFGMGISKQLKI